MRNGKYASHNSKKVVVTLLALVLVLGCAIGGTIAWLTDTTDEVVNTFSVGDVEITLKESPLNEDGSYGTPAEGTENEYQMIPGKTYKKDPVVAVDAVSEDCWLFVKFEEKGNPATYIDYTSTLTTANGWTQGDGTSIPANVWYREVKKSDTTREWHLLDNDQITIKGEAVTKENMEIAAEAALKYTAYAVQMANGEATFTAAEAWAKI